MRWLRGLPYILYEQDKGGGGGGGSGDQGNNPPKMVPESDLLAVKRGAEKDISDLKAQLTDLQTQVDSKHQESTSERAKRVDLETQIVTLQGQIKEVESLRTQLAASEKSRGELEKSLLDTQRQSLVTAYGLKAEDVKDLTKDQLALAESLLSKVPRSRGSYDRGGTGGGDNFQVLSARDKIRLGLTERG